MVCHCCVLFSCNEETRTFVRVGLVGRLLLWTGGSVGVFVGLQRYVQLLSPLSNYKPAHQTTWVSVSFQQCTPLPLFKLSICVSWCRATFVESLQTAGLARFWAQFEISEMAIWPNQHNTRKSWKCGRVAVERGAAGQDLDQDFQTGKTLLCTPNQAQCTLCVPTMELYLRR